MIRAIKRSGSFGRRPTRKAGPISDLVPDDLPTPSETYHPKIRSNLEIHTEGQGFKSHNEIAFERYGLNAILDFPNPYHDYEIPDDLKNHMNKNISVPNGEDGNNVKGSIIGIKNIYINDYDSYLPFYIVLFQADGQHKEAIVKLVYTNKTGIKVLGIETEDEMMALIEKAKAAHLANQNSVEMKILDELAKEKQKKPVKTSLFGKKKGRESIKVNVYDTIPEPESLSRSSSLSRSLSRSSSPTASGKTKRRRRKRTRTRRRTRRSVNKGKKTKGKKTKRR